METNTVKKKGIKVGIIEDNTALRDSVVQLINSTAGMHTVYEAYSLHDVLRELIHARPDIILLDIDLPGVSGIEGVSFIKANFPDIQVLMFTVFEDDEKIFAAIRNGASGYLLKKTGPPDIIRAIVELKEGGAPMSASIARRVVQSFRDPVPDYNLTPREKTILNNLVEGMSYKKIAETNFISISTVRTHISKIYEKLHVNSKAEAVARALKS